MCAVSHGYGGFGGALMKVVNGMIAVEAVGRMSGDAG